MLDTLLQDGGGVEAEEAGAAAAAAAAVAVAAAAAPPLTIPPSADVTVARRVVARWRAFVAARKACPLLDLLQRFPDCFKKEVLERLDPTDRTMVAQVGRPWLAAMLASELPRLPKGVRVRLRLSEFCTSVERLPWAKANGCPWGVLCRYGLFSPCALAAEGGHLEVVQWAREHGSQWNAVTCHLAAMSGHLEVLRWAWKQDCPWNAMTCANAAWGGHLDVLRWAREHGCPWNNRTTEYAAGCGHLDVLQWARAHGCPWGQWACRSAAAGGHLAVLQWARAHDCPWNKDDCKHYAQIQNHPMTLAWVRQQPA